MGAFSSTKMSTLNFRQLPVANGIVFFKTSKTEGQPREVYPNFRKIFNGRFLSIHFCSRDFQVEFLVEWFPFRTDSTASGISRNFSGKSLYHLPLFPNFRKFWLNVKRPLILCTINFKAAKINGLLAYFVSRQSQGGLVKYQLL